MAKSDLLRENGKEKKGSGWKNWRLYSQERAGNRSVK